MFDGEIIKELNSIADINEEELLYYSMGGEASEGRSS